MKRILDIILSLLFILLFFWLYIIISILILIFSSGPIIFTQKRVGYKGKLFNLYKFRTMSVNAESQGPQITIKDDPRITSIGRILRRTKLDELPSLWNVIKGDMSLVGPRPEVPGYIKYYKPEWMKIFNIKPGITDLATLQFRDEETILNTAKNIEQAYIEVVLPIKIKIALQYLENRSLGTDIKILLSTIWALTLGKLVSKPDDSLANFAIQQIKSRGL